MEIKALDLSARSYGVLEKIGIDTVEDLCQLTAEQLMGLGNFGKKSLDDVLHALERNSPSLNLGTPNPRLLISFPGAGVRFNRGFTTGSHNFESLSRYTVAELHRIEERLRELSARADKRSLAQLRHVMALAILLRQIHQTVVSLGSSEGGRV